MPGGAPEGTPGGAPGMPGAPGGGMPGAGGTSQPADVPPIVNWIYEQPLGQKGVVLIFGFDEDGRVVAITLGDGYDDSVNRGGTRSPAQMSHTARSVRLGDMFPKVIKAYGFPETQQNVDEEVVLTYYEKAGVAFSMKQGLMRVTSMTIREMPKSQ